jgi:Raf kinase inhibitor-like YbhB/YbcL family protein
VAPLRGILVLVAVMVTTGCDDGPEPDVRTDAGSTITVSSEALAAGQTIPRQFTCDGDEVSPPLSWSGGTGRAWALVVDDPDAPGGTYVHWVVLDIPPRTTNVGTGEVPAGGVQVVNSSGHASYAGPCPPSGEHRYRFTIYGLDAATHVSSDASLDDALAQISDHATSTGTLTATYSRH